MADNESEQYPQIGDKTISEQNKIYLRNVYTFFATSTKLNKNCDHIFFTNHGNTLFIDDFNLTSWLNNNGVDVQVREFNFEPQNSDYFTKSFYKFDCINEISKKSYSHSLLLDVDCVWLKPADALFQNASSNDICLYDVYESPSIDEPIHGLTRREMTEVFSSIDENYPKNKHPTHFGGEALFSSKKNLKKITQEHKQIYRRIQKDKEIPKFSNEKSIYDNDEYINSLVCNKLFDDWKPLNPYIKRVWTPPGFSNVEGNEDELCVWHLPSEKKTGLKYLFESIQNNPSDFESLGQPGLTKFIGKHTGVQKRPYLLKARMKTENLITKLSKIS
ncbi:hypothetical protein [Halobacterium salinarum]|uniref:hypothetical protein n=1 Tax=Halobacterium salinarum TaxID=2242 RepID=UPI00255304BA|nr:hypothetical protein [Halobacterium salinarum]